MTDIKKQLEVFIITNGRSTYEYCKKSIDLQREAQFDCHIIKDKGWLEAHLEILSICNAEYALRVDDDMFLHPLAICFMLKCLSQLKSNVALRGWRLWEPWSGKICKGIKIYNIRAARKIGFVLDRLGKIDKPFTENAGRHGFKIRYSDDIVAIHSCGSFEEHLRYWKMRGETNGPHFKKKKRWARELINNFSMSLDEQYLLSRSFIEKLNKNKNTNFWRFLTDRDG